MHEGDNVLSEITTHPAFLLHQEQNAKEFVETPTQGKVKQLRFAPHFWYWRDNKLWAPLRRELCPVLVGWSSRNDWLHWSTPFLLHDDHCFQFQRALVAEASLSTSERASWRCYLARATVAAQSGVFVAIAAAPRLQQNESEKVEQLVAQFTEKPLVVMCNQPTRQPSIRVSAVAAQRMQKGRGDPKRTLRLITPLRTMVRRLLQCQMLGPLSVVKTPTSGSKTPRLHRSVMIGSVSGP